MAYFVERYGEEVSLVPRRQGLGLALWWGPVAIFVLGGAVVARTLWSGRRSAPSGPAGAGGRAPAGPPGLPRAAMTLLVFGAAVCWWSWPAWCW